MRISTAGIARKGDRVLIALRRPGTSIGRRWEFPGGKAERGESPRAALRREFAEELGLEVEVGRLVLTGAFANGDKEYRLLAYEVDVKSGEPRLTEHAEAEWAPASELDRYDFASSDAQIAAYLRARP